MMWFRFDSHGKLLRRTGKNMSVLLSNTPLASERSAQTTLLQGCRLPLLFTGIVTFSYESRKD
jgi:hypothetical protein